MAQREIEITDTGWGVLARTQDKADMERRLWFDVTDKGRLVFCAEIVEDGGASDAAPIRHYVPDSEMDVPDPVREELEDEGYETIVDTDGYVL